MSRRVILCGSSAPGRRDECPNRLHDWPLPNGYVDAGEEAARRLARGWRNVRCHDCGLYGWRPSLRIKGTTAEHHGPTTPRPEPQPEPMPSEQEDK